MSPSYPIQWYTPAQPRAIAVAMLLELKPRLSDAALYMPDRLIGFALKGGKNAQARRYAATSRDVGRLMGLFCGAINALKHTHASGRDFLTVLNKGVGWTRLLRVQSEVGEIAYTADVDCPRCVRRIDMPAFANLRLRRWTRWRSRPRVTTTGRSRRCSCFGDWIALVGGRFRPTRPGRSRRGGAGWWSEATADRPALV